MAHAFKLDRFELLTEDTITLQDADGNVIDEVIYQDALDYPSPTGSSFTLAPDSSGSDNDTGSNWCLPSSAFGLGDFGTPAAENETYVHCLLLSLLYPKEIS